MVLLILAGVAINLSLGNNGIFNKAKYAREEYLNAKEKEETELAKAEDYIDSNRENNFNIVYDLLWEGTANTVNQEYNFKQNTMNINNYKFILIEYKENHATILAKSSRLLETSFIKKNSAYDIRLSGYATRYTDMHFTDNGFILDTIDGDCFVYPQRIIGISF